MSSTSIWVPISSAVAALFGAGFGAALQGRYGVAGWRRQIRLEAYTRFLNAAHDFDNCLFDALDVVDESHFDENRQKLEESFAQLLNAETSVAVAGPRSVDKALRSVGSNFRVVIGDVRDRDAFISVAHAWKEGRPYDKWDTLHQSARRFEGAVRRILKTE